MRASISEPSIQVWSTTEPAKRGSVSAATVQPNVSVAVSPSSSSAVTVAVPEPGVVGVPDKSQAAPLPGATLIPSGSPAAE